MQHHSNKQKAYPNQISGSVFYVHSGFALGLLMADPDLTQSRPQADPEQTQSGQRK